MSVTRIQASQRDSAMCRTLRGRQCARITTGIPSGDDEVKSVAVAVLAALSFVLGLAQAAENPDVAVQNATVQFDATERTLRIDGVVGQRFESDVRNALARNPQARRVVVSGPGGLRAQALRVAELINARQLPVRVAGRCASACALLWAAANTREMTVDSGIGLHRSGLDASLKLSDETRQAIMARNDQQTDAVLRKARFPERVIIAGAATPAESMSWFSPYELKTGGVPFVLLDRSGRVAALDPATGRVVATAAQAVGRTHN